MAKGKKRKGSHSPQENTQAALEDEEISVTAGGGVVKLTMTGKRKVRSLEIDPEIIDPDDVEMLQDIIMAAVNDALDQVEKLQEDRMGGLTDGLNLPPGLGL